jgi:uncharacterized protein (UPF0212 family)
MVATKKCPHCYTDIDARATVCPNCGKKVKTKKATYQLGTFLLALGLVVVLGGFFIDPTIIVLGLAVLGIGAVFRVI